MNIQAKIHSIDGRTSEATHSASEAGAADVVRLVRDASGPVAVFQASNFSARDL
ncbi:MAG: hypothetical protein ACOH2Q_19630 [Rhodococcus sp. (in: high G+C Gram-positive bacteria)]